MTKQNKIQLFEEKKVRTVWDEEQEKWCFSAGSVFTERSEAKAGI